MKILRDDQALAIQNLREAVAAGERRIVLQAPTGFGKTVVEAVMTERARGKKKRVLITVPALSLVDQTVTTLSEQDICEVGVMQADHRLTDSDQPVQVASVATLQRRALPQADLVLIDEVHKWFKFYERWLCDIAWQRVPIIGLSATPWTKGLGSYFNKLVIANTIADMIAAGTLSKFRVFAPTHPDLKDVRITAGDYNEGDLASVMSRGGLVADIVASWKQLGEGRPTVCFAVNRDHADQITREFEAAGVPAGYLDCDSSLIERSAVRAKLKSGTIKVVCNVDVIGLGVDWPEVACISYARPTRSEMRYVQNIGRGLRPYPGKTDLIVIDHSDTTLRLGFVSDIHHDTLHDGKPRLTAEKVVALPKECPKCHFLKRPRMALCPNCGFVAEAHAKPITPVNGQLREITSGDLHKPAPVAAKLQGKAETYGQLLFYARQRGYKDGWAANKYRAIYGVWPRGLAYAQHFKQPEMVLRSWIQAQNIARAKSQAGSRWRNGAMPSPAPASNGQFVPGTLMTEQDIEDFR